MKKDERYPVLVDLIIKKEWFDKILSGEKKEEYRSISEFNVNRLCDKTKEGWSPRTDITHFRFFNGYKKDRPWLIVKSNGVFYDRFENEEKYKVPFGTELFTLELGEICETNIKKNG